MVGIRRRRDIRPQICPRLILQEYAHCPPVFQTPEETAKQAVENDVHIVAMSRQPFFLHQASQQYPLLGCSHNLLLTEWY